MKIKNKIVSYFVVPPKTPGGMPRVFPSPVTMNATVAKELIIQNLGKEGRQVRGELLHVCFDVDSDIIYVPNATSFRKETMRPLLQAAQIAITQDFGGFANRPPIEGSPFNSIRVRAISSFNYATKIIKEHHKGKVFNDLPVVEAYLKRMPSTVRSLPDAFRNDDGFYGGYISPDNGESISFVDEIDFEGKARSKPSLLLTQKTPFILVNISREAEITAYEKEWVVLSGYRDYLYDAQAVSENEKYVGDDISEFADLYTIKRYLYLGWPLEEISRFMLSESWGVTNFTQLINAIRRLMVAVQALVKEGYRDPSHNPYYITFKIDPNTFPIPLRDIMDMQTGRISVGSQDEYFRVIDYDLKTAEIIIESRAYLSPDICKKVLMAKSNPLITTYNPVSKTIDVKSDQESLKTYDKRQVAKMKAIYDYTLKGMENAPQKLDFRFGDIAKGVWSNNFDVYYTRKISDYYYAYDFIMGMCKKSNIPFRDLDVIVGPIENFVGLGTKGGFFGEKAFRENNIKIPHQVQGDLWITPPVILINRTARKSPTYAEQTSVLIHEYRHYLFEVENPTYEKQYGNMSGATGDEGLKQWYLYFSDLSEGSAHREQIKYELLLGKSVDEIIRDKVEGVVTLENYPIALKYREMVEEVAKQIEGESEEEPTNAKEKIDEKKKPIG